MDARHLLSRLVELSGGPAERGFVLALDCEGLERVPDRLSTNQATYQVYRPSGELELRRILWRAAGAPFIAILKDDLARRLPLDLLRRARGARVQALDVTDVLSTVLGVRVQSTEDPEVNKLVLNHLEALKLAIKQRTVPTVLDGRLLDELLLDVCVGKRVRTALPGELLAEWLEEGRAAPGSWEPGVVALLHRNLPHLHAMEGRVLAWALRTGRLETLVVQGALLAIECEVPPSAWGDLGAARGDRDVGLPDETLRAAIRALVKDAYPRLPPALSGTYLTRAESAGRLVLTPPVLAHSTLLPLGLDNRCSELSQRVVRGEVVLDSEIEVARRHLAAPQRAADLAVLEELARLGRYLAEPVAPVGELAVQVERYQRAGAFADLCALRLRRALAQSAAFHREAEAVLLRYRQRRDAENEAFARTLAADYERALHAPGVIPLHRVWTEVVRREPLGRGVFVVVLDGCSYPVFLEMVYALNQHRAAPLGFAPRAEGAVGLPGLSLLPTVTSHARGALFLGDIPSDPWVSEENYREGGERTTDPGRFRQNRALGDLRRQLFLKGDLADGGQGLLQALDDATLPVVAAVFNAIDDQIGSANTGALTPVAPEHISGLLPSLRRALAQGRRVLVVADHGHTPYLHRDLRVGAGATPRYRELGVKEAAPEGFMEIALAGLGGLGGRKAFAFRMGVYQGSPQVGFHGGCSLEEMVVPMAWLAQGGSGPDEPVFWYGHMPQSAEPGRATTAKGAAGPPPRRRRKTTPVPEVAAPAVARTPPAGPIQTHLFESGPTQDARAAGIAALRLPEALVARLDAAGRAALVMLAEVRSARSSALAQALNRPPGRMDSFMRKLLRVLHDGGVRCVRVETLPDGEAQYHYQEPG